MVIFHREKLSRITHYALRITHHAHEGGALRGRFLPLFHPGICCLVCGVGSRQEMVFSLVRR
ncbi:hypothetical protein ACPCBX_33745, partial [Streptomyces tuirus]|uniref:hypothetical protein n=1 Tax=Streptomyces tuirus TaxID=68278 RepID=UPI0033951702